MGPQSHENPSCASFETLIWESRNKMSFGCGPCGKVQNILYAKLWAPKVTKVLAVGILKLSFGSPGTKCSLDVAPVERCKIYYKGEGGGFP
jgi:hypothetical protein